MIAGLVLRSVHLIEGRHRLSDRVSCHRCLTSPSVPAAPAAHLNGSPASRQHPCEPGHQARVSGRLYAATGGRTGHHAALSRRLSAAGLRLLRHPFPPGTSAPLAVGLPRRQHRPARTRAGFPRSARMRPGWDRASSIPRGRRCRYDREQCPSAACRLATASPCHPGPAPPSRDAFVTRHQQGFTGVRPSSLPLTCGPQTARRPLGFPLSFTPPGTRYPGACQGGDRSSALTRATCPASAEPPSRSHSQRATSCRNRSQNRTAALALRGQH